MNHPLVSLGLVVLVGVCLVAYLLGFSAGKDEGHTKGHDEGRQKGKKEGAVRAFAVGYDRGKREREEEEGGNEDDGDRASDGPSWLVVLLLILGTVAVLTLLGVLRGEG